MERCKSRAPIPKRQPEHTKRKPLQYQGFSRKEAIFDGLYTKEEIVDDLPVVDEYNIEKEDSGVTVVDIYDL